MSRLTETEQAYRFLARLIDQASRTQRNVGEIQRFRAVLDAAFYLTGWAQFEYLIRKQAEEVIEEQSRSHTLQGHAWRYMLNEMKNVPVRKRLDLIFHNDQQQRKILDKDYNVRNEVAHDYKLLPSEARDLSTWLKKLEDLVEKSQVQ